MKKNYLRLLFISLAVAMSVGFVSCKGDGSEEQIVSGEAEKFIGAWRADGSGDAEFYLFPNGTCASHSWREVGLYEWVYDESTRQLTTTWSGHAWTVSLITNEAWTGISIKEGKSLTYKRDNASYFKIFEEMMEGGLSDLTPEGFACWYSWLDAENNDIKITKDVIEASNIKYFEMLSKNNGNSPSSETEDVELFNGNITISNYGKKNAKMTMDGTIIATGGKINKTYGARKYIKDKAIVPVEE